MENGEYITIPITNGAPVRIRAADWPVVARGSQGSAVSKVKNTVFHAAAIFVRQHVDGRSVAEAVYVVDGEEDRVVGRASNPLDEETLPFQIKAVFESLVDAIWYQHDVIVRAKEKALASLPPIDLE